MGKSPFECKYKPEYAQRLVDMAEEGKFICHFCGEIKIARSTFYEWINNYSEFAAAYAIAKNLNESYLVDMGISGIQGLQPGASFNATAWSIIMRNKCNYAEHRKIKIDFASCKSTAEKVALLDKHVSEGRVSTTEAKHLSEYIASCVKIDENTEAKKRLEEVEKSLGIKK